jgi:hypothetical protein
VIIGVRQRGVGNFHCVASEKYVHTM